MTRYALTDIAPGGLVRLSSRQYGRQLWAKCTSRKQHACQVCKQSFPIGSEVYRPITNAGNRMERICEHCIERPRDA